MKHCKIINSVLAALLTVILIGGCAVMTTTPAYADEVIIDAEAPV